MPETHETRCIPAQRLEERETRRLTERNEEQHRGNEATLQGAPEELQLVEEQIQMARPVQLRIQDRVLVVHVLVEDADRQDRQRGVEQIVHRYVHGVEHGLENVRGDESRTGTKRIFRLFSLFQPPTSITGSKSSNDGLYQCCEFAIKTISIQFFLYSFETIS